MDYYRNDNKCFSRVEFGNSAFLCTENTGKCMFFFKLTIWLCYSNIFLQIVLHSFYVYVIPINFTASKIFILAVPSVVVTKPCLY